MKKKINNITLKNCNYLDTLQAAREVLYGS